MKSLSDSKKFILHKKVEVITLIYILVILMTGLVMQPLGELMVGLKKIFMSPGTLITDYMMVGGIGPAFFNSGMVALIGYLFFIIYKVPLKGVSIDSMFMTIVFGMKGQHIWSILTIITGVLIYCKLTKRQFKENIHSALFATALAPLVTQVTFGFGWGLLAGITIGILVGMVVVPVANHLVTAHEGYNLYNMGFALGFIGLIFLNVFRGLGYDSESVEIWSTEYNNFLRIFSLLLFLSMIASGIVLGKDRRKGYIKILKSSGRLPTDFLDLSGFENVLINMWLVGLTGMAYIELVGGSYNGPTLSGLFTMIGFAAFGKHPFNIAPIMAGVWIGSFFSIYHANGPGPLLAALYGTCLAPIAGQFGPIPGILAGILHLAITTTIGTVHGGLNLYNNGFAAGIVASFFIAIVKGYKKINKEN
mgnify:CR=1 FL=1